MTFNSHKAKISSLKFHDNDTLLFSGSFDTNIIGWDIIAENKFCKLKGHKNGIT